LLLARGVGVDGRGPDVVGFRPVAQVSVDDEGADRLLDLGSAPHLDAVRAGGLGRVLVTPQGEDDGALQPRVVDDRGDRLDVLVADGPRGERVHEEPVPVAVGDHRHRVRGAGGSLDGGGVFDLVAAVAQGVGEETREVHGHPIHREKPACGV
jgi:hypothetical protein